MRYPGMTTAVIALLIAGWGQPREHCAESFCRAVPASSLPCPAPSLGKVDQKTLLKEL